MDKQHIAKLQTLLLNGEIDRSTYNRLTADKTRIPGRSAGRVSRSNTQAKPQPNHVVESGPAPEEAPSFTRTMRVNSAIFIKVIVCGLVYPIIGLIAGLFVGAAFQANETGPKNVTSLCCCFVAIAGAMLGIRNFRRRLKNGDVSKVGAVFGWVVFVPVLALVMFTILLISFGNSD